MIRLNNERRGHDWLLRGQGVVRRRILYALMSTGAAVRVANELIHGVSGWHEVNGSIRRRTC